MYHLTFGNTDFTTAVLIKESALVEEKLRTEIIKPLVAAGYPAEGIIAFSLDYGGDKKPKAKTRKEYLNTLLPALVASGVTRILCADGEYFKTLTKVTKVTGHIGYTLPCLIRGFEALEVGYIYSPETFFYSPENRTKNELTYTALVNLEAGVTAVLGSEVLKNKNFIFDTEDFAHEFGLLSQKPKLAMDIETSALKAYHGEIVSISFSEDQHTAVVFDMCWESKAKRELLKEFLTNYQGVSIWHNASFDITWLIFHLWMEQRLTYQEGLHAGLEVMTRNFECTKILSYLATNSCSGNDMSLKGQAHEFAGNYAVDIENIFILPTEEILEYNGIDTCSTMYVYDKNRPIAERDEQMPVYKDIFLPSLKDIIQMQLTGLPINKDKVAIARRILTKLRDEALSKIHDLPSIIHFIHQNKLREVRDRNAAYVNKVITIADAKFELNLNSNPQVSEILYGVFNLPVIDKTPTKAPATGGKTLKKLMNHTDNTDTLTFLTYLKQFIDVDKLLGTFIKQYEEAPYDAETDWHYLLGSFNLGSVISGRLSSSGPNLQNQPSGGSKYAKIIKQCFEAPEGYLLVGLDFNSLEDYISALLTRDKNKLKVYTDGYDSHCLRAYYYRDEGEMPDIMDTLESINSIKQKYPAIRDASKPATFALTYLGTWNTLVRNLGYSPEKAKRIANNFAELYAESIKWVDDRLQEATKTGYVRLAFGLRLRTPLLSQVILGTRHTPPEAEAEARSAGNALGGQSYGLLNNRAGSEFLGRVRNSEYVYDIRPSAQIHDAQYFIVKDDFSLLEWMNKYLVKAVQWQELPELQHDTVKLGGELSIFYPTWADEIVIPNYAEETQIIQTLRKEAKSREK